MVIGRDDVADGDVSGRGARAPDGDGADAGVFLEPGPGVAVDAVEADGGRHSATANRSGGEGSIGDGSSIGRRRSPTPSPSPSSTTTRERRTPRWELGTTARSPFPAKPSPGVSGAQAEASHAAPEFLDHHTSSSCRTRTRRNPSPPNEEAADDETTFSTVCTACPTECPTVATL